MERYPYSIHMNNETHYAEWNEAFHSFKLLGKDIQSILRNCAVQHMIERGCEEVGSSDVNHELFSMYRTGRKSWQQVVIDELEDFAEGANQLRKNPWGFDLTQQI